MMYVYYLLYVWCVMTLRQNKPLFVINDASIQVEPVCCIVRYQEQCMPVKSMDWSSDNSAVLDGATTGFLLILLVLYSCCHFCINCISCTVCFKK